MSQAYLEELASATECEDLATKLSIVNGERTEPGQTPTVLLTLKYPNVRLNHSIKSLVEADALNIHTSPSALFRVCIKKYFNEQLGYDDRIWTDEDCTATLLMKEYSDEINAIISKVLLIFNLIVDLFLNLNLYFIVFIRNLRGDFNSKIAKAQLTQIRAEKRNKKKNGNIVEKEVDTGKNVSENNESEDEDTSDEDIPPAKKAFITNKLKKTAQTVDSSDEDIPPAKKPFAFEKESIRKFNFKRTTASNILSQGRLADLTDMSIGSSDSNEK